MSTPYTSPESDLEVMQELELTFATLSFWRKLYIVLIWVSSAFIALILLVAYLNTDDFPIIAALIMGGLMIGLTYWHHYAIVKRDMTQITILAVINFVPLGNFIGCLIMIAIRRVTRNELANHNVVPV